MRMISVLWIIGCALIAATSAMAAPGQGAEDATVTTVTYLIHTEIEAIWNRQMSMLIGNSVIISAIKLGEGSPALNKGLTWAGLALCVAWGIMDWQGWNFSHVLIEDAKKAAAAANLTVNPYVDFPTTFGAEIIFYCAMSVVLVFFLIYIWLLKRHGWWKFWQQAK